MEPALSVIIPTLGDRPDMLDLVTRKIELDYADKVDVVIVEGETWGGGVNRGMERIRGKVAFTLCDDTVPVSGWIEKALSTLALHNMPAARYFNSAGAPLTVHDAIEERGRPVSWTRIFTLTPAIFAEVGPLLETTWYTDNDYSQRLDKAGWPIVSRPGFDFTHLDGPRNWQTAGVVQRELDLYNEREAARCSQ